MTSASAIAMTSDSDTNALRLNMAHAIRVLAMDAVEQANSGHPGMPMGMADVATVLFSDFLSFDPAAPDWQNRDRFILSAGHGSMLLYALLYLTGYEAMSLEQLKQFRQLGSITAGHPEYGHAPGIETTTGPLGQGIANAVGFALGEAMMAARFGTDLVDHYTYVIAGDGCLMEGISQEAISLAGHLALRKLIVLWDDNRITIDGSTDLSTSEHQQQRFEAAGWEVQTIDGHDHAAIAEAISRAQQSDKPSLIACRTTIAFGAPTKAGSEKSHGAPLGQDEIDGTRQALGWAAPPFDVPEDILAAWRAVGAKGHAAREAWESRLEQAPNAEAYRRFIAQDVQQTVRNVLADFRHQAIKEPVKEASRKSSQRVLEVLTKAVPQLVGGSADLTGSNLTKTGHTLPVNKTDYSGSYLYYGIREHGMAACMNGLALYGGFIPYGGTFLVFSDYCRPAIRLSSLMQQRVIYVMTHDSIGLGEDGPTHQPVEHLAALRAIPGLHVFRPADVVETAEAWELAIGRDHGPSLLALSRQGLPQVRLQDTEDNLTARGAYVLSPAEGKEQVTLVATGSEVYLAMEAQARLRQDGIDASVVSMPCSTLFDEQPETYQAAVFPKDSLKVAIEAASSFGWERYIGRDGIFIGMHSFGASAPAPDLYRHFGITVEAIVEAVKERTA